MKNKVMRIIDERSEEEENKYQNIKKVTFILNKYYLHTIPIRFAFGHYILRETERQYLWRK